MFAYFARATTEKVLAKIRPLSASAELKKREFWVKEKKITFIALLHIGKKCEEFYSEKEKNGFSDRNHDWDKHAFFFHWGNLSHQKWS